LHKFKKTTPISIQALWAQGLFLHQNNDLIGAKANYEQILQLDPNHFDSLYLSSAIATQEEKFDLARRLLKRALEIRPTHVDALFNLSVILEAAGENDEALSNYENIIERMPAHIKSRYNYASLLAKLGRIQSAMSEFKKVIELQPDLLVAQQNYEKLLWSQSQQLEITSNTKNEFVRLHQKGLWLLEERQFQAALEYFNQAIMIEPLSLEGNHNKGIALEKMGRLQEALHCYQNAIKHHPTSSKTHNNIGNIYRELNQNEDAINSFENALELDPNYAEAYSNLGWTLYGIQEYQKSKECFQKALEINPDLTPALFNLSLSQLILGEFEEGWVNYEHRKKQPLYQNKITHLTKPQWDGVEPIAGKTIYIYAEQGLGDTIQFCRYIKFLSDRGANVLFEPQTPLHGLLSTLDGVGELLLHGQKTPPYDFHCPLMSLPLAFRTNGESIPNHVPYLHTQENKRKYWENRLADIKGPKVGLVWSGGFRPNNPELWEVNKRRNIPFEILSQINIDGIQFFSLQKGESAEAELIGNKELLWPGGNFYNFTNELQDFSDTAALVEQLDLVISVDTSTAHLAGALGRPTWILNRFDSCWRWLAQGETSSWYPTAKLYRQKVAGDWRLMIQDVKTHLRQQFKQ
jgi:tetratricopeptide (TPR) repeat protein